MGGELHPAVRTVTVPQTSPDVLTTRSYDAAVAPMEEMFGSGNVAGEA